MENLLDAFFAAVDSAWFKVFCRIVDVVLGVALIVLLLSFLTGRITVPPSAVPYLIAGFVFALGFAFGTKMHQRRSRNR